MTLNERIRYLRQEKGLTQKELADKLGVTQVVVGRYERGERKPKIGQLIKIAQALEVPEGRLIDYDDIGIKPGKSAMWDLLLIPQKLASHVDQITDTARELPADMLIKFAKVLNGASIDEIEQIIAFGEVLRANADNLPTGFSLIFSNDKPDESEGGNA